MPAPEPAARPTPPPPAPTPPPPGPIPAAPPAGTRARPRRCHSRRSGRHAGPTSRGQAPRSRLVTDPRARGASLSPCFPAGRRFAPACSRSSWVSRRLAALSGCDAILETPPAPTPADFQGIAADLVKRGVMIDHIVSGDSGCDDMELQRSGDRLRRRRPRPGVTDPDLRLHLPEPGRVERLRQTVDACARSYVVDPESFESVEQSPFVVAGAGPWAPDFHAAIRAALVEAAGTGN